MPYPDKICPKCGAKHNKRRLFCSLSCGNSRKYTEEDKEKRRKALLKFHATAEGEETRRKASQFVTKMNLDNAKINRGEYVLQEDDWYIDIPVEPKYRNDMFSDGKDIWRTVDEND